MEQLLISPTLLAGLFFAAAFLYGSVGLGGGSTYAALLAVFGAGHRAIPPVTLTLNLVVTVVGAFHYIRAGHADFKLIIPVVAASMPMAFLGGYIEVEAALFYPLLAAVLALVAARIFLWSHVQMSVKWNRSLRWPALIGLGATIGFVSGMVGIGGGIFLVPLILILGLGDAKAAAATGAMFVFLNSASGLVGHLQHYVPEWSTIVPMAVATAAGGFLGAWLGANRFSRRRVQKMLGVVVIIAVVLLLLRMW